MNQPLNFLATQFGIQDIKHQAGNEFAWNSVLDTQACIIEAGYNISVMARKRVPLTYEIFDELYTTLLQRLNVEFSTIPHHKDSHWEESMRSSAIIHVLEIHKKQVHRIAQSIGPALVALYEALGQEEYPYMGPEEYFRNLVEARVLSRAWIESTQVDVSSPLIGGNHEQWFCTRMHGPYGPRNFYIRTKHGPLMAREVAHRHYPEGVIVMSFLVKSWKGLLLNLIAGNATTLATFIEPH